MPVKPYLIYSSEGARSRKNSSSLTRRDFESDLEWIRFCAEQGIPWCQTHLAVKILVEGEGRGRVVEAYMWLYLARLLDAEDSTQMIDFLSLDMSREQIEEGIRRAESWVEDKWTDIQSGRCDFIRPELRAFFRIT
jgi:hypothetical protein